MRKRFPLVLCGASLWLSPLVLRSSAEEKPASSPETVSLEQIPARLTKLDAQVKDSIDALTAAVDVEIKAKRIPPAMGETLRFQISQMGAPGAINEKEFFAATNLPLNNEAVAKAAGNLQEALLTAKRDYTVSYKLARDVLAARVKELTRHGKTPEEIDVASSLLDAIQDWVQAHTRALGEAVANRGGLGSFSIQNCKAYLRALSRLLADLQEKPGDIPLGDISQLLNARSQANEFVSEGDFHFRISSILEPSKVALEESRKALTADLLERKPSAEVSRALQTYEEVFTRHLTLTIRLQGGFGVPMTDGPAKKEIDGYKALTFLARDVESRQWNAVTAGIETAIRSAQDLNSSREAELQELVEKWNQEEQNAIQAEGREFRDNARTKLAAVKKPEDLEALAAELQTASRKAPGRNAFPSNLANELTILAAAWKSRDVRTVSGRGMQVMDGQNGLYAVDLQDIRSRIARELLAQVIGAPELKEPPFSQEPLDDALEHLRVKLAEQSQWSRVLRTLEAENFAMQPQGADPSKLETIASVRAFLGGQNFELAEQWTEAARCYKAVLRAAGENTPVKEAAIRLKTLAGEHAAEVKAAQSPEGESLVPGVEGAPVFR